MILREAKEEDIQTTTKYQKINKRKVLRKLHLYQLINSYETKINITDIAITQHWYTEPTVCVCTSCTV